MVHSAVQAASGIMFVTLLLVMYSLTPPSQPVLYSENSSSLKAVDQGRIGTSAVNQRKRSHIATGTRQSKTVSLVATNSKTVSLKARPLCVYCPSPSVNPPDFVGYANFVPQLIPSISPSYSTGNIHFVSPPIPSIAPPQFAGYVHFVPDIHFFHLPPHLPPPPPSTPPAPPVCT